MADIREQLNVISVRMKIEKAQLLKMGKILRRNVDGVVKQAVRGWYSKLEEQNEKTPTQKHHNIQAQLIEEGRGRRGSQHYRTSDK